MNRAISSGGIPAARALALRVG